MIFEKHKYLEQGKVKQASHTKLLIIRLIFQYAPENKLSMHYVCTRQIHRKTILGNHFVKQM